MLQYRIFNTISKVGYSFKIEVGIPHCCRTYSAACYGTSKITEIVQGAQNQKKQESYILLKEKYIS